MRRLALLLCPLLFFALVSAIDCVGEATPIHTPWPTASPIATIAPENTPELMATPTQTPGVRGAVILVMDDAKKGFLEDVAVRIVQINIDENIDIVVNVIPHQIGLSNILTPKLKEWNATQGGLIEIGHHGYDHSEYMGDLSYAEQKAIVEKGLAELSAIDIHPTTFTPPYGSQNTDTLSVLADLGFHTDLDCWKGLTSTPEILVLNQCPCLLCDEYGVEGAECNLKSIEALVSDIDNAISNYGYAVVLFHMQDLSTTSGDLDYSKLDQYRLILQNLKNNVKYQLMTAEEYYQKLRQITLSPTPAPTRVAGQKFAGVRASSYGITPFPSPAGWSKAVKAMLTYWPDSTPLTIWLVGDIIFDTSSCRLQFPNQMPEVTYPYISFENVGIDHEKYLNYFDVVGIKVLLSVEPGNADVSTLIDLVLNEFGHHPCVIGLGLDVEWNKYSSQNPDGVPVTDTQAQAWEAKVKSYNSNFWLFLKHWSIDNMPLTYRGNIIFVNDGQGFSTLDSLVAQFKNYWAASFPSNPVLFQVGYENDRCWWEKLSNPPKDIGNAIYSAITQDSGVIWVDFTVRDVLPTE